MIGKIITGSILILLLALGALGICFGKTKVNFYYLGKTNRAQFSKTFSTNLPNELIIKPGNYKFNQITFILDREGLYRFSDGKTTLNRVVYEKDPWALVTAMAYLEGNDKESVKSTLNYQTVLKDHTLSLSCGHLAEITRMLLKDEGIESRVIHSLNLNYSWTDQTDNGHTLNEILINGKWQVVDLENDVAFFKDGRALTFYELVQLIKSGQDYDLKPIAQKARSDSELKKYYQKVFGVPIMDNGKYLFYTAENDQEKEKVSNYSHKYRFMPKNEWLNRFYAGYSF